MKVIIAAYLTGRDVMEQTTVVTILMKRKRTVHHVMRQEISHAKIRNVSLYDGDVILTMTAQMVVMKTRLCVVSIVFLVIQ